jgi:hypothetical protein
MKGSGRLHFGRGAPDTRDEEFAMKKECLGSLTALLAGAGLSLAQPAPAPAVLASPAPNVRPCGARAPLPLDLPPTTDATPASPSNPDIFPFPGTGVYNTLGCAGDLPPYVEPASQGGGLRGTGCEPPRCHVWASADPLLWWVRPGRTAAGDGSLDYGLLVGGRVAAGFTNAAGDLGIECGGFWLPRGSTHLAGTEPGESAGALSATSSSQVWGAETNVVSNAFGSDCLAIDLLGGLRYVDLDESLAATDCLRTRNQFLGGQLGSQVEVRFGRLYTNLLGKVAVGNMHQIVDVAGGATASGPGGVPALGTSAGRQAHDEFGVVPELNFNVGYQLRPGIRLYAGYTFLYLNDVARPGDQGNATVNTALVPVNPTFGTAQPGAPFNHTDYWAQGVNIGLALRY